MNKKGEQEEGFGETGNAIKAITMLFFATFMTLFLIGISVHAIEKNLKAEERVDEFLTFETIRHCFLYENNGRVYYDMIDRTKFTDEQLKKCLPDIPSSASLSTKDNKVIETAENGLSAIAGASGYTYYINVKGSDELHKLTVRT